MLSKIRHVALVLSFGQLALPPAAVSQRSDNATASSYADSCLPASEFQLREIALHADGENALEHLGKWVRIKTDSGEDDGGRYERQTYYFRDIEIEVVRGLVTRVATHSAGTATPSGLRPGLSRDAVRRLLLTKGVTSKQIGDTLEIAACSTEELALEDLIELAFDRTGRVRAISMSSSSP